MTQPYRPRRARRRKSPTTEPAPHTPPTDPNVVERAALYLALDDLLDPDPGRPLATISTTPTPEDPSC